MNFDSCGPFYFPRKRDGQWRKEFWTSVEDYWEGLSEGVGCYAFCLEREDRVVPWYVGKTIAQGGFASEVFTPHKLDHYDAVLSPGEDARRGKRGEPCIILFPLVTEENWNISKSRVSSEPYIDWLETTLIGMALSQNPEIANTSKTRFHREVYVNGLFGPQFPGRASREAKFAKRAFVA